MSDLFINTKDYEVDLFAEEVASNLLKKCAFFQEQAHKEKLLQAVSFAIHYHGSQTRASGEPYFYHPIAVAEILAEYRLDVATILTAILHDTVEDTEATLNDIEKFFGQEIRYLVDGVTKLTQVEFQSYNHQQAENFRKFLLAISEDLRVLLIKLADRLHNMSTLHFIKKPEKRERIARETMDIYAPLAERIGIRKIKEELQALAFAELNPKDYKMVTKRLEKLRKDDDDLVSRVENELNKTFIAKGLDAEVHGREKRPYSIWKKMQNKHVDFEQIADIIAFRVIVKDIPQCYQALGHVHQSFHAIGDLFRDYISTPKNNGYQSLHTVVIGPENHRIEIQIRTQNMHEISEYGVAAHWSYKQGRPYDSDGKEYRWIRELLHILEQSEAPEELLEDTKLAIYHDQVFCFTPAGDLIVLPRNATPVDFAYEVHSEVGYHCVGAKINGRVMPLRSKLKNGDQVEILQSKTQTPSPSWEAFVVSAKARAEIRKFKRHQQRMDSIKLGKSMLEKIITTIGKEFDESLLQEHVETLGRRTTEGVYAGLGDGTIHRNDVIEALYPDFTPAKKRTSSLLQRFRKAKPESSAVEDSIPIRGINDGSIIDAGKCCCPIPGDRIVGIVGDGSGITIHNSECSELEKLLDDPTRWVTVDWDDHPRGMFAARLRAMIRHERGALGSIANEIANADANIQNINITDRADDYYEIMLEVEVRDQKHLEKLMSILRADSHIHSIERFRSIS